MSEDSNGWRNVTAERPCPVCGKPDWCRVSGDGSQVWCPRVQSDRPSANGYLHGTGTPQGNGNSNGRRLPIPRRAAPSADRVDLAQEHQRFREAMDADPGRLAELVDRLGVTAESLRSIGIGWANGADLLRLHVYGAGWATDYPDGVFSFPERDGAGRLVGLAFRAVDGRKGAGKGMRRGLTVPADLHGETSRPVLLVEGASDVAACAVLGLAGLGRPSNTGGADDAAVMVEGREMLVVGENDPKPDGSWPGRSGAGIVAAKIAQTWGEPVPWAMPPTDSKDVRDWLRQRVAGGLDLHDAEACKAAGAELLAHLRSVAVEAKPGKKPSQAEMLVRLALERYRTGRSLADECFAVSREGPNIALMFRGSRDSLRGALAREYRRQAGTTPTAGALADALVTLAGMAQDSEAEPVALRLAEHDGGIVLDLGDAAGRAVMIRPGGWEVVSTSPVLFRRTALTGALPEPERGGDLAELRELLNIGDEQWDLLVGWMVASLLPEPPHPIMLLGGLQGTGKTSLARLVVGLIDASPAPLRSQPREPEQWALSAAGSWCIVIDNISAIPLWWSDALCKAVTGDGWTKRMLYTDGELSVVSFKRVMILTSIDAGSLKSDMADRLLMIDLEPISDTGRLTEAELGARYRAGQPRILGALLDLTARVLAELPEVHLDKKPRMADFAKVLAAVDAVRGSDTFGTFTGQRERLAGEVVSGDPVGEAVMALAHGGPWSGTATELLRRLAPDHVPHGWPRSPKTLAGQLRRMTPALGRLGVEVEMSRAPGGTRPRIITIRDVGESIVPIVPSSRNPAGDPATAVRAGTMRGDAGRWPLLDRPEENAHGGAENQLRDGRDDRDDELQALSLPDDTEEL